MFFNTCDRLSGLLFEVHKLLSATLEWIWDRCWCFMTHRRLCYTAEGNCYVSHTIFMDQNYTQVDIRKWLPIKIEMFKKKDLNENIHPNSHYGTLHSDENLTIAPVPAKQPWWIWINTSCECIMNDCITTTKQSTTKPCAYFLGYTVLPTMVMYAFIYPDGN